jgi:hypothetical protein
VVIGLLSTNLHASELLQVLGHLVQVELLETLICPHPYLNQLTYTPQNKGGHGTGPAHSTPSALLSTLSRNGTLLSTLTSHGKLRNLLQVNHVPFLSHPLIISVMHCISTQLLVIISQVIAQLSKHACWSS